MGTKLFSRSSRCIIFNRNAAFVLWLAFSLLSVFYAIHFKHLNNYVIYEHVWSHMQAGLDLYQPYPAEYYDVNLYGPVFGLIMAPFTWLPEHVDVFCWIMANGIFLIMAVRSLPIPAHWKNAIIFLSAHEFWVSAQWVQCNAFIAACIILAFSSFVKDRPGRAAFYILLGSFVKLYAITAIVFFLFTGRKTRFIAYFISYGVIFFFLPLLVVRFDYLLQSYRNWYSAILSKAELNKRFDIPTVLYQDISVMGMIRRISRTRAFSDLNVLIPAAGLFFSQLVYKKFWPDARYQLYILCSVLIATVIFSSSAESTTYIIVLPAFCIWWLMQNKTRGINILFVLFFWLTTFAYTDLLPRWTRVHLYHPYSLKALPGFILWLIILVQVHRCTFLKQRIFRESNSAATA